MNEPTLESPPLLPWRLEQIDFASLERDRVRADETLLFMLTCASFMEVASAVYTRNLSAYYSGDQDLTGWLNRNLVLT